MHMNPGSFPIMLHKKCTCPLSKTRKLESDPTFLELWFRRRDSLLFNNNNNNVLMLCMLSSIFVPPFFFLISFPFPSTPFIHHSPWFGLPYTMKRLGRQARISLMLSINATFFVAEIAVGYYASSLALVCTMTQCISKNSTNQ